MEDFSSHTGDSYFDWDYCLGAIGEPERGFSCEGSCCSPVLPQDIGQLLLPGALCIVQPNSNDFKQCPIRQFRLTVSLGVTWG